MQEKNPVEFVEKSFHFGTPPLQMFLRFLKYMFKEYAIIRAYSDPYLVSFVYLFGAISRCPVSSIRGQRADPDKQFE